MIFQLPTHGAKFPEEVGHGLKWDAKRKSPGHWNKWLEHHVINCDGSYHCDIRNIKAEHWMVCIIVILN
jgi:hypothetical protein